MQLFSDMAQGHFILAAALSSLFASAHPADSRMRVVIHGTIAQTPPAARSRVKVCVSVFVDGDFAVGEGDERTFCADTTTNEDGQFTAAVSIPPHWRNITASEVCVADRCWTGNAPASINPHANDATGEQTADVAIVYE
jgi:hypothetical protein